MGRGTEFGTRMVGCFIAWGRGDRNRKTGFLTPYLDKNHDSLTHVRRLGGKRTSVRRRERLTGARPSFDLAHDSLREISKG